MTRSWGEELNPAQREAVTHADGPLLVVAGAGTGKTRTLACRVAYLIEQGVRPERILLLTFTRRAAAEMLQRAEQIGRLRCSGRVWGGTFHAVGNRLLRIYGPSVGLSPDFTVMDEADAADLMNLLRGELGLTKTEKRFPQKHTLVGIHSRMVNAEEDLGRVLAAHYPWCRADHTALQDVFDAYDRRKREQNVFDYDDLLLMWRALCSAPGVGGAVADRFEHVLVDEYQDTNVVQAQILRGMRKRFENIMVVGDDAQSIYSFRAATVRNILDFPEQFSPARIVTLEENYRSTQPILDASNAVMAVAKERYTKNLYTQRSGGGRPVLTVCPDEVAQSDCVCDRILAELERGVLLRRQAVLFRAGHHSSHLEVELTRRRIPFRKYGGLKFIETAHIKDVLAFLRILENPYDQISWFRVLQMLEGGGPQNARKIMAALGVYRAERLKTEEGSDRHEQPPAETDGGDERTLPPPDAPRSEDEDPDQEADAPVSAESPLGRLFANAPRVSAAARAAFEGLRRTLAYCCGVRLSELGAVQVGKEAAVAARPDAKPSVKRGRRLLQAGQGHPLPSEKQDDRLPARDHRIASNRAVSMHRDKERSLSRVRKPLPHGMPLERSEEGRGSVQMHPAARGNDLPTPPTLGVQLERIRAFYEPIFQQLYDNASIRIRDIEQLGSIAASYRSRRRFVTDLTLDPPVSAADWAGPPHLDDDYLVLSTIHSAKGLEWDAVHILHAADGMIPSDMATGDEAGVDEERRLLYLAMTRAKNTLHVYHPLRYYYTRTIQCDAHGYSKLTRFVTPTVRAYFEQDSSFDALGDRDDADGEGAWDIHREVSRKTGRLWRR